MLSRCIIIIFCALLATKLVLSESTAGIAEAVRQYDLLQQQQPPDDPVAEDEKREDEVPPLIRSPKVVTFVVFAGDDEKYDDLVHAVQCVPLCKDLRIGCLPEEKDALEYRIVRVGPHTSVVSAAQAIGFGPGEAGRYRATIILAYGLVGIETAAAAAITRSAIVRMEPSINTIRCSADGKMLDVPPLYVESPLALRSMQSWYESATVRGWQDHGQDSSFDDSKEWFRVIDAFSDVLMLDEMSQPFQIKDCTDMRMEGVTVIFDGSGNIQEPKKLLPGESVLLVSLLRTTEDYYTAGSDNVRWLRVRELADVAAGKFADSPLDRARDCLTRAVQISETLDAHEFLKLATCAKVSPHPPPVVITDIPKPRPPRERNPEQTEPSTPTDAMTVQRSHPIMPESRLWPPRRIIEIFGGILSFFKGVFGILASGWLRLVIACWEQVATIRGAEETAADQPEEVAARMENRAVAISVAMISTVLVLIAAFFFWRLGMRMATPSGTRESSGRACR